MLHDRRHETARASSAFRGRLRGNWTFRNAAGVGYIGRMIGSVCFCRALQRREVTS